MRPEVLQSEFVKILESTFEPAAPGDAGDPHGAVFALSEEEMFQLWNMLGEELGIDLALASPEQRRMLFEACEHGKHITPRDFGSLLWLVYYGDAYTH
jgi:hypothetical protein